MNNTTKYTSKDEKTLYYKETTLYYVTEVMIWNKVKEAETS